MFAQMACEPVVTLRSVLLTQVCGGGGQDGFWESQSLSRTQCTRDSLWSPQAGGQDLSLSHRQQWRVGGKCPQER